MALTVFDKIISDRGSVYAVSGGPVTDRAGIDAMLAELTSTRRFAKATHHSWAAILDDRSRPMTAKRAPARSSCGCWKARR